MKQSQKKKLIIFDMDGTLINSSITIANAINFVRAKLGLDPMDRNLIMKKVNDHEINPAKFFYGVEHFTKEQEKWFSEYYSHNHDKELALYDGIKGLLLSLVARDIKIAVATNAYRRSAMESLRYLAVHELFDIVACHDDVSRGKPYPDMLHKILQELNISADEALFVGDGTRDQIASQRAGIDYLMVNWGFSEYEDAISTIPDLKKALG